MDVRASELHARRAHVLERVAHALVNVVNWLQKRAEVPACGADHCVVADDGRGKHYKGTEYLLQKIKLEEKKHECKEDDDFLRNSSIQKKDFIKYQVRIRQKMNVRYSSFKVALQLKKQ